MPLQPVAWSSIRQTGRLCTFPRASMSKCARSLASCAADKLVHTCWQVHTCWPAVQGPHLVAPLQLLAHVFGDLVQGHVPCKFGGAGGLKGFEVRGRAALWAQPASCCVCPAAKPGSQHAHAFAASGSTCQQAQPKQAHLAPRSSLARPSPRPAGSARPGSAAPQTGRRRWRLWNSRGAEQQARLCQQLWSSRSIQSGR